jgi:putative transposase
MHLIMQLRLLPAPGQDHSLLATMERFNAACDSLAAMAFQHRCANKVELQKLAYHRIRRDFGLSAQMTVRAIAKVVEVYKRDKAIKPTFRPHDAVVFDQRILLWKGADRVSMWTLDGRALMPWVCCAYQPALPDHTRGQADLSCPGGVFFLQVTVDVGDATEGDVAGALNATRSRPIHDVQAKLDPDTKIGKWTKLTLAAA